jgi:hypothetical protein
VKFNRKNLDTWLEALRSGHYKQGKTQLRKGDQFCCLGVACDVAGLSPQVTSDGTYSYAGNNLVAPDALVEWLGFSVGAFQSNGFLKNGSNLAHMNDIGTSFEDIADVIEKNYVYWLPKSVES